MCGECVGGWLWKCARCGAYNKFVPIIIIVEGGYLI